MSLTLDTYRLLGRSGLRVSPLALGTATFGTDWGWGADREEARTLFDQYTERGGNFIDTAATYTNGSSERLLGEFAHADRDRLVLASKYTTLRHPGDPNSGGSQRKNLFASIEDSLRALATDYLDLFYLHVWDTLTPVDEILRGMDDLVRQGKILYLGISTAPAWQVSRMQTIADLRGWSPLTALQIEYNLIERGGENDLIPMAQDMGLGVVPFSPLAGGVLTGKYSRADLDTTAALNTTADTRSDAGSARKQFNIALGGVTERSLDVADVVKEIAIDLECTPAQIGLAWLLQNPDVTSPIIGARTPAQLTENLGALDVELSAEQLSHLNEVSATQPAFPHATLASDHIRQVTRGNMNYDIRR